MWKFESKIWRLATHVRREIDHYTNMYNDRIRRNQLIDKRPLDQRGHKVGSLMNARNPNKPLRHLSAYAVTSSLERGAPCCKCVFLSMHGPKSMLGSGTTAPGTYSSKVLKLFRSHQFHLYLCKAEVQRHQTSQSSWFFWRLKTCSKISFPKQADCVFTTAFSGPESPRDFRETPPGLG